MMRVPPGAPIVTAAQMRAAEAAVFASGVPQDVLMERAGAAVAREAARFAMGRPILVVAGPGNNGGDGYVAARLLRAAGLDVALAALGAPKQGAAAQMRARWDGPTTTLAEARPRPVLVDGLFGTGLTRPLDSDLAPDFERLSNACETLIAIDLPSGLGTDDGADLGWVRPASATVAFAALKPGHLIGEGIDACGMLVLADIGVPVDTGWHSIARPRIAAPGTRSHKYTRGMVVVVAGAMPGAGRLAARAAAGAGAGYVVYTGDPAGLPDAIVHRPARDGAALADLLDDSRIGAVVIGPGLGRDARARDLLDAAWRSDRPMVLDGDAFALFDSPARRAAPLVCTPHSGEFDRLFGAGEGSKIVRTLAAADAMGATIVHKGADTVIGQPDAIVRVSSDAPPWLSTAGTGDVLAGILGARLAAGGDAASEAVWLHARAAQLAGPAFYADQLIPQLSRAIAECL